jgi:hypothetical protein
MDKPEYQPRPFTDEDREDIQDQLDAEFAERLPDSVPITIPPAAPADLDSVDRFLAELVRS